MNKSLKICAEVMELVDIRDLKSLDRKVVRVQVSSSVPLLISLKTYMLN